MLTKNRVMYVEMINISCLVPSSKIKQKLLKSKAIQVNLDMTDPMGPRKLVCHMQNPSYTYEEYLICIGPRDQAYCPSYAKICRTVVRHIQVRSPVVLKLEQKKKGHHSPTLNIFRSPLTQICFFIDFSVIDRHYKPRNI